MKPVALIPARYDATRLPGKPLLDICGKPLIQRVYDQVNAAGIFSRVLVATDSDAIFRCVSDFGGEAVMTSPAHRCGSERIAEAAEKITEDYIVNVQGDELFLNPLMLKQLWESFRMETVAVMGTLQHEFSDDEDPGNPNAVKVVTDAQGYALYFSRSSVPYWRRAVSGDKMDRSLGRWYKHIGVYIYRKDFLLIFPRLPKSVLEEAEGLEQLRVLDHGYRLRVYTTEYQTVGVDTKEDLEAARRQWPGWEKGKD